VRWYRSLKRSERLVLLILALSVVAVISLLVWNASLMLGAGSAASPGISPLPSDTPSSGGGAPLDTATPPPGAIPSSTPTLAPTFDVSRAGVLAGEVADARQARTRWGTPLTLVDSTDMAGALYTHYQARPPLVLRMRPALEALKMWNWDALRLDVVGQAEETAAFYVPELSELYLRRDWRRSMTTLETHLTYGYARALPDQYGDLNAMMGESLSIDRQLALDAVADGDALVSVWLLHDAVPVGPSPESDELRAEISRAICPKWQVDDPLLQELSCLSLELGAPFVTAQYQEGGLDAMDNVILRPPRSTEQLLHPDRYAASDEPRAVLPVEPGLGDDWSSVEMETLGEALMGRVMAHWSDGEMGGDTVTGWGGDLLQVWQSSTGDFVSVWQMDWDDARTASNFYGYLLKLMPQPLVRGLITDTTAPAPLVRGRWWAGRQGAVFLYRRAGHVVLAWGQDAAAVESVSTAALP
jgi:hypothetical protein